MALDTSKPTIKCSVSFDYADQQFRNEETSVYAGSKDVMSVEALGNVIRRSARLPQTQKNLAQKELIASKEYTVSFFGSKQGSDANKLIWKKPMHLIQTEPITSVNMEDHKMNRSQRLIKLAEGNKVSTSPAPDTKAGSVTDLEGPGGVTKKPVTIGGVMFQKGSKVSNLPGGIFILDPKADPKVDSSNTRGDLHTYNTKFGYGVRRNAELLQMLVDAL